MMEQRISAITLAVADVEASARFYETLGWQRVQDRDEGIVVFQLPGQVLGLYPKQSLARDMGVDLREIGGFSGITLGHNVREKDEVDAIWREVEAAGGRGLKAPHEIFWGGYSSYVADPDGHVWEIAWNPFSPPREDGGFYWDGASGNGASEDGASEDGASEDGA